MAKCLICLSPAGGASTYHPRCLKRLFGAPALPQFDLDRRRLTSIALDMAGRMSVSGVQEKVSLVLAADGGKLIVAASGGHYLLKPQASTFLHLPENEHLTMRLASLVKIAVPPCGMLRLADGSLAYIVSRFDRSNGGKLPQEDFCQLAGNAARDKYDGSAELCVRLVRAFASKPGAEILKLYRLILFAWCVGDGDLHLKNLALLTDPQGQRRLSPAYDLLNTRLVIPGDQLALSLDGRKDRLTRRNWLNFGNYAGISEQKTLRLLAAQIRALARSVSLVERSELPAEMRAEYEHLLRTRTADLER
jgi:serine/threonine-protein kinase HipA